MINVHPSLLCVICRGSRVDAQCHKASAQQADPKTRGHAATKVNQFLTVWKKNSLRAVLEGLVCLGALRCAFIDGPS